MLRRSLISGSLNASRAFAVTPRAIHTTPAAAEPPNKPEDKDAAARPGILGVSGK